MLRDLGIPAACLSRSLGQQWHPFGILLSTELAFGSDVRKRATRPRAWARLREEKALYRRSLFVCRHFARELGIRRGETDIVLRIEFAGEKFEHTAQRNTD